MYCLVDFRNRPQLAYTFKSHGQAREYLKKIKNNPLGITVLFKDGRREYFENGLPARSQGLGKKIHRTKKGFHAKYFVRKISTLDSARNSGANKKPLLSKDSWSLFDSFPVFALGNKKLYSCLIVLTLAIFSTAYFFQTNLGVSAIEAVMDQKAPTGKVLGASFSKSLSPEAAASETSFKIADENVIISLLGKIKEEKQGEFEKEIMTYIKGKPMEDMAPYIASEPRTVAAFIVGIAMKESKFGVYAPHDSRGFDCHNYWGYRGPEDTTDSGYSCFATPEQAVKTVGDRIARLVDQGAANPEEMVVWKCGATCSWDNPEDVRKWISDVGINFYKINS